MQGQSRTKIGHWPVTELFGKLHLSHSDQLNVSFQAAKFEKDS